MQAVAEGLRGTLPLGLFLGRCKMEPRGCLYHDQFGYCWLEDGQWLFQAVDEHEQNLGGPVKADLADLMFEHEEDED